MTLRFSDEFPGARFARGGRAANVPAGNALVFPSNGASPVGTLVAFQFTGADLIPGFPATYIWRVKPVQQTGYYTTFFHARIDGAVPFSHSYYGCHPYPQGGSSGTVHNHEISTGGADVITDANGNSTVVTKGQWYTQAFTIEEIAGNECRMAYYWDLGTSAQRVIQYDSPGDDMSIEFPTAGGGVTPGLIWGDAPWSVGNERLSGSLGQIKLLNDVLSLSDIQSEAANMNALVTVAAQAARWWFKPGFASVDDLTDAVTGKAAAWANANKASPGEAL